jgi:hypothetical protein
VVTEKKVCVDCDASDKFVVYQPVSLLVNIAQDDDNSRVCLPPITTFSSHALRCYCAIQAADAYMLSGGIIATLCLATGAVVIFGVPEEKTGKACARFGMGMFGMCLVHVGRRVCLNGITFSSFVLATSR